MNKYIVIIAVCLLLPVQAGAGKNSEGPGKKPDIVVMTQNQYLGADLTPIITAPNEQAYAQAVLEALLSVAGNNLPERAQALAESIADRKPHLVGLQEVFQFGCIDPLAWPAPGKCAFFSAAFNDHLTETLDALGGEYYVAAVVENINISSATFPLPGLPVYLGLDPDPDLFVTVLDRDVILARHDVVAFPVPFWLGSGCPWTSEDGCNFNVAAKAPLLGVELEIKRGFVGVDAEIDDVIYRFVNTHLEVQFPSDDPSSPFIQAAQATQLLLNLNFFPMLEGTRQIVVGDINSSPDDLPFWVFPDEAPPFLALPPYAQLTDGVDIVGQMVPIGFADTWDLRPGKPAGDTCCQLADLSNAESMHDERIDVIFAWPAPGRVKANVLDNDPDDKTLSGLWPSDHSSVAARLYYED